MKDTMIMESGDAGFGNCWCHAGHNLGVGADGLDGLCGVCRGRSPSACQRAHEKTSAAVTQ